MGLCRRCGGTGRYLGNGFVLTDCNQCPDEAYEHEVSHKIKQITPLDKIDRRSKSYRDAIKDIMNINKNISYQEAVKMFDEAYVKG